MGKVFNYEKWKRRKLAIIHIQSSDYRLKAAYDLLEVPIILYEENDPDLEKKFMADSDSICGIVIGGGPSLKPGEIEPISKKILNFNLPKLGICLGHEILGQHLGSKIVSCDEDVEGGEIVSWAGEVGEVLAKLFPNILFEGLPDLPGEYPVSMNHFKMLEEKPKGSQIIAETKFTPVAGFYHPKLKIWGLQFIPQKNWLNTIIFNNYYNYCLSQI